MDERVKKIEGESKSDRGRNNWNREAGLRKQGGRGSGAGGSQNMITGRGKAGHRFTVGIGT